MGKFVNRLSELKTGIKLLPFLLLYIAVVLVFRPEQFFGDESRYLKLAYNLLSGFYSPGGHDIYLRSGPGYPLFILPFLALKLPLLAIRIANGVLLYLSLIFSYKAFTLYVSEKTAFRLSFLLGIYLPVFASLPFILTECLSWFLISFICLLFLKCFSGKNINPAMVFPASLAVAYLALTRVMFGYCIVIMIMILLFLNLIKRSEKYKTSFLIFLLALVICMPYLYYTWRLTGRFFYWADNGGLSLYTMSTPYENEHGDWHSLEELAGDPDHSEYIDSVLEMDPVSRDIELTNRAFINIRNNPGKYLRNWIANIGRMLFSYPFEGQDAKRALFTIIPNMFLLPFLIASLFMGILNLRKMPEEIFLILLFILVYLFGSSLLSAYKRMFYITVPFWFIYISCVFGRIINIRIRK